MKFTVEVNGKPVLSGPTYQAVEKILRPALKEARKRRKALGEVTKRQAVTEVTPPTGEELWERRESLWAERFGEAAPAVQVSDDTPRLPLTPAGHMADVNAYAGARGHAVGQAVRLADYLGHADLGRLAVPGHGLNTYGPSSTVDAD